MSNQFERKNILTSLLAIFNFLTLLKTLYIDKSCTLADNLTFNIGWNSRITLMNYQYERNKKANITIEDIHSVLLTENNVYKSIVYFFRLANIKCRP